jgi:hypothetical protein
MAVPAVCTKVRREMPVLPLLSVGVALEDAGAMVEVLGT